MRKWSSSSKSWEEEASWAYAPRISPQKPHSWPAFQQLAGWAGQLPEKPTLSADNSRSRWNHYPRVGKAENEWPQKTATDRASGEEVHVQQAPQQSSCGENEDDDDDDDVILTTYWVLIEYLLYARHYINCFNPLSHLIITAFIIILIL